MPRTVRASAEFWSKTYRLLELPEPRFRFESLPEFFFLGSCFADRVAEVLRTRYVPLEANPTGTLFHPRAIANTVRTLLDGVWAADELFERDGLWRHPDFPSKLSRGERNRTIDAIDAALSSARARLLRCDVLVLTFGTNVAWSSAGSLRFWANCHKLPESTFTRTHSGIDEMAETVVDALQAVAAANPNVRAIVTVSPVRYLRPNAAENSRIKASLRLACDAIVDRSPVATDYFAASELVLDELRDYRWYDEDGVHPSDAAVRYVASRFWEHYAAGNLPLYWERARELERRSAHLGRNGEIAPAEALRSEFVALWPNSTLAGDRR